MRKVISIGGILALILFGLIYLFYFYLPGLAEPEGASLEVKNESEIQKELGFTPVSFTTHPVFLPEIKDTEGQEKQLEEQKEKIGESLEGETEASKEWIYRYRKSRRYRASQEEEKKETKKETGSHLPSISGRSIEINLSAQKLYIWENENQVAGYSVSTGKRGMATPTGTFYIKKKIPMAYSSKYHLYMPYWMAFTAAGHGIHELPIFKSGAREGASHLGRPVSHGCVRLGVGPAQQVYNWVSVGTPVVIHY